jgi:phage tail-like protein
MATDITGRTRLNSDPLRNFKFQVQVFHSSGDIQQEIGKIGFTSVEGLNMSTEMIPYREGGWNTNPHKLPGMTDFSPVTMSSGVFYTKPGMWDLAKQMFSVQWGNGTIDLNTDYRYDLLVRVFDHPVTTGEGAAVRGDTRGAVLGFWLYNAWTANVAYSGLNAMDNAILVSQMTVHHEGMDVVYGFNNVP